MVGATVDDQIVKDRRRRRRDIQQDVVERRVISDGVAAANDRGIILPEKRLRKSAMTHARGPGEPEARREIVFVDRDLRKRARGQGQALEPDCGARVALPGDRKIVQLINGRARVLIAHAKFQS